MSAGFLYARAGAVYDTLMCVDYCFVSNLHMQQRINAIVTGVGITVFVAGFLLAGFVPAANAQTRAELEEQIHDLKERIAELEESRAGTHPVHRFSRDLGPGDTGEEVRRLQRFLNDLSGVRVASAGAGAPGEETAYYGPRTEAAVKQFQRRYRKSVLAPLGLAQPTGFFGARSRAKANQLLEQRRADKESDPAPAEKQTRREEEKEDTVNATGTRETATTTPDTPAATSSQTQERRTVEEVDTSVNVRNINGDTSAQRASYELSFSLSAIGDTVFIPDGATTSMQADASAFGLVYEITGDSYSGEEPRANVGWSGNASDESPRGSFELHEGERERFRLSVTLSNSGGRSGFYGIRLRELRYAESDSADPADYIGLSTSIDEIETERVHISN